MIYLYNTASRKIEEFHPIEEGKVGMYTCGPTVYNYAHIGNLRTFIFEDVLKKMFKRSGYEVKHVMNITDVGHLTGDGDEGDDKMLKEAEKEKKSVWDIAAFYTDAFFKDESELDIERATYTPKATDNIKEIIELIEVLEEKGYTYRANGNVYFSIDKFPRYADFAHLSLSSLNAGERVAVDASKKNPHDFVLWFTNSKFGEQAMMWDSPFGRGYPGWHIECSAMSMKYLGKHFDIHCGGVDAIPVHHTNEIAQSEAATGEKWVNYWLHGEFLLSEKGKMSKSTGEFLTLELLKEKGFLPLSYRYFVLGCHYRKQLQFSYDALKAAENGYKRLKEAIKNLKDEDGVTFDKAKLEHYTNEFDRALYNDMNMPVCLAVLHSVVKDKEMSKEDKLKFINDVDRVLSLELTNFDDFENADNKDIPESVTKLASDRFDAKKAKNWALADSLRAEIEKQGYKVLDTKEGWSLEKI